VFNHGVIQQIDRPTALYEKPANNFVANFIGENNALEGTVESVNGDFCQVRLDNGAQVQASIGNVANTGARTVLSVRPESIQLNVQSLGAPTAWAICQRGYLSGRSLARSRRTVRQKGNYRKGPSRPAQNTDSTRAMPFMSESTPSNCVRWIRQSAHEQQQTQHTFRQPSPPIFHESGELYEPHQFES